MTKTALASCLAAVSLGAAIAGCSEMDKMGALASSLQGVAGLPAAPSSGFKSAAKSPIGYVTLATLAFLEGGETLMGATGHATDAAKCKTLRDKIKTDGPNRENLGEVNEVAASIQEVAAQQQNLDRADATMVTQAAIRVGVATWFETLAVKAAKDTVSSGHTADIVQMTIVGAMAPSNLQSMMGVQKAMFSYLKVKGIDPTADIQREVSKLEKA